MALIYVEAADEFALKGAQKFAEQLKVPVGPTPGAKGGVKLIVTEAAVGLGFVDKDRGKPYFVDFLSSAWRARFHQGLARNHIFRRALGVRDEPVRVVDATAGLGQDAAVMVSIGCMVTAVERSPAVAAVLQNGIDRGIREDEVLREKLKKLRVVQADAIQFLAGLAPADQPDVVYLDPMFSKPKKSAKSPKEMQLLQELLSPAVDDEEKLFTAAMAAAKVRVVVKRPIKARAVKSQPTHSFKGQSIRYDVYLK